MKHHAHDLIVVGAGSAGYAAARTAREVGCDVALVDRGPLGGLCILRGCMPSKALLASSDALADAREATALGIDVGNAVFDMPFIASRKRSLVREFADYRIEGIEHFPLYSGSARFLCGTELAVGDDTVLKADRFIIATGSEIRPSLYPGLSEAGCVDSDGVLELERIPESTIVLGGGYTACELGQFLSRMGSRTHFVIRSRQLLTAADDDIANALTNYFEEEGMSVTRAATIVGAKRRDGRKVVECSVAGQSLELEAEEIFYALGRAPSVTGLDLENAGVAYDANRGIAVDATLRTTNPRIFAIGDVTGDYMLVHVAIYQGEVAARNACMHGDEPADYRLVSAHTIFSDPQVAAVGASEKDLVRAGTRYVRGRYDFAEHGKAQCLAKTKGFVKMMADAGSGRILGAAAIGPQASELIHEIIVAMNFEATVAQLMRIPHLHPTLSEIWTYPAEICAAQLGMKVPGDDQLEVATSVDAAR